MPTNEFGQPVGPDLGAWKPPPFPTWKSITGRTVTLDPLDTDKHAEPIFRAMEGSPEEMWTYTPYGPFTDIAAVASTINEMVEWDDWQPYAVVVDHVPLGFATYLRIKPRDGVIEVGGIAFSPALQRTTAATESLYLLIRSAFDAGYRRCEWKCDDLNSPSRVAAERLGFRYEGTFQNATHYKGRNRDTAWYAITDAVWPRLETAIRGWLSLDNFGATGRQRAPLRSFQSTN